MNGSKYSCSSTIVFQVETLRRGKKINGKDTILKEHCPANGLTELLMRKPPKLSVACPHNFTGDIVTRNTSESKSTWNCRDPFSGRFVQKAKFLSIFRCSSFKFKNCSVLNANQVY